MLVETFKYLVVAFVNRWKHHIYLFTLQLINAGNIHEKFLCEKDIGEIERIFYPENYCFISLRSSALKIVNQNQAYPEHNAILFAVVFVNRWQHQI